MKQHRDTLQWFARGGGIAKMGPYKSQAEAAASLLNTHGVHVEGAFVWPEVKMAKSKRKR